VVNDDDAEFFLDIKKFLPERCIPEFRFSKRFTEFTNSNIWGTTIFWVYDGMMCVKDIVRFSNMSLKEAELYYGEDQVSKIFPLDHMVCRTELISTSLKTLDKLISDGDLMWAPIPDPGYRSVDGRDLNLDVINSMRVRLNFLKNVPKILSNETYGEMQVTYRYYDTFNLLHKHLSRFVRNGPEGAYYWRDINQNQDFKDLEAKMMVRLLFQCISESI
jgi:hypothetical protein